MSKKSEYELDEVNISTKWKKKASNVAGWVIGIGIFLILIGSVNGG